MQNVKSVNGKGEVAVQHTAFQTHVPHHIIGVEARVVIAAAAEVCQKHLFSEKAKIHAAISTVFHKVWAITEVVVLAMLKHKQAALF